MKNLPELLSQFNWIDIFVVILALRIIYIAFKNGLKFEFFKVLGTLSALYLSLHYYTSLSDLLNKRLLNNTGENWFFDMFAFAMLASAGYGFFFLIRFLLGKVSQSELNAHLDKWGGLALGICRAALAVSLSLCFFLASSGEYFRKSVHGSFSGPAVARIAPGTYIFFWNTMGSKLQGNNSLNPAIKDLTKI